MSDIDSYHLVSISSYGDQVTMQAIAHEQGHSYVIHDDQQIKFGEASSNCLQVITYTRSTTEIDQVHTYMTLPTAKATHTQPCPSTL